MVVLGLILILLAVLLGGYTVMGGLPPQGGTDVTLSFLGLTVQTSAVVVFALGALTLLLVELGVLAMRSGTRTSSRRRAELHRLRRVEAEVQTRQSADVQRNATATPATTTPAPFARRDTGDGDAGRTEAAHAGTRPDTVHRDKAGAGPAPTTTGTHRDITDVRPPETSGRAAGTGSPTGTDRPDGGTRTDRT